MLPTIGARKTHKHKDLPRLRNHILQDPYASMVFWAQETTSATSIIGIVSLGIAFVLGSPDLVPRFEMNEAPDLRHLDVKIEWMDRWTDRSLYEQMNTQVGGWELFVPPFLPPWLPFSNLANGNELQPALLGKIVTSAACRDGRPHNRACHPRISRMQLWFVMEASMRNLTGFLREPCVGDLGSVGFLHC